VLLLQLSSLVLRQEVAAAVARLLLPTNQMKHTAKTLKRLLKKAGLKRSGTKKTLRARAKRAHLVRGGDTGSQFPFAEVADYPSPGGPLGGRRRRRRPCKKHSTSSSESSSN
jgi:hypothetical protein